MLKLLIALALLAAPALAEPAKVQLGDRFYLVELPAKPDGAPMILALHGGGGWPAQFAQSSGLGRVAAAAGYAVIFPAGSGRRNTRLLTWNGGYCCGYAQAQDIDDAGFITSVIQDAASRFGLDPDRVYLTGMSNGAIMAETYAAQHPARVRAVAAVSGTFDAGQIKVAGPVPLLIIHGTQDQNVPYTGGTGKKALTTTSFAPVSAVVAAFLGPWGKPVIKTSRSFDRRDDGTSVIQADYHRGKRLILRLITITGGGHVWPGDTSPRKRGETTTEITANAELLRFFAASP